MVRPAPKVTLYSASRKRPHFPSAKPSVQRLLPQLSIYLGHINIQGTQRYLTLIPELLREASDRFEQYAMGSNHE
jgi:hypothetical protein